MEKRQAELSDQEKQLLRQGIARAQQGKREAVNGPHVVAQPKGRPSNPPGTIALAARPAATKPAARRAMAPEPVQLTSGTTLGDDQAAPVMESAVPAPMPAPIVADAASPAPAARVIPSEPAPLELPAIAAPPATVDGVELPGLPASPPEPLPDLASPTPAPAVVVAPMPEPAAPMPEPVAAPVAEPATPGDLPTLGSTAPAPEPAVAPVVEPAAPAAADLPTLPSLPTTPAPAVEPMPDPVVAPGVSPEQAPMPAPASAPAPAPARVAEPAQDPATVPAQAASPEPPLPPDASTIPPGSAALGVDPDRTVAPRLAAGDINGSFLSSGDHEYVARLAQRSGTDSPASERANAANPAGDPNLGGSPTQGSTRLELQRAPSPTEARPIRSIPVPEEFVSLTARDWSPNRKYWAAAGSCHMTLYFQDPVLERYGQGVEQALGTRGRYFSYPLDDPKQSNQRNQILQPFWSIGKFCFQVGTLPYKLVVDPPWEAEYDLGYYRPGDKIPPDTIMITPTGVGPPLKGRRY